MKSFKKIATLADSFEQKLVKQAAEVDSTMLTLAFRPKLNDLWAKFKPQVERVLKLVGATGGSGDIHIGQHFFTTASKATGKWVIDPKLTHIQVTGDLADNPSVRAIIGSFNMAAVDILTSELNRMSANIEGDTITNHDSSMDGVDYEI